MKNKKILTKNFRLKGVEKPTHTHLPFGNIWKLMKTLGNSQNQQKPNFYQLVKVLPPIPIHPTHPFLTTAGGNVFPASSEFRDQLRVKSGQILPGQAGQTRDQNRWRILHQPRTTTCLKWDRLIRDTRTKRLLPWHPTLGLRTCPLQAAIWRLGINLTKNLSEALADRGH